MLQDESMNHQTRSTRLKWFPEQCVASQVCTSKDSELLLLAGEVLCVAVAVPAAAAA